MGRREQTESKWGGKYSNKGQVDFTLTGTVNSIREDGKNEVDYVEFFIENQIKKTNICLFTVTVGWDLPQLEEGQEVNIFGIMRTWRVEGQPPRVELVAQQVEIIPQEQPKSRRA